MYKVKIADEVLLCEKGELLSELLIKNGKSVEHPCGGRGTCKKCKVLVDGREELSCLYKVNSDICVELFSQGDIVSETGVEESGCVTPGDELCLCVDIGTTTLALALVDNFYKRILKVTTATNPQRSFGADVMSRIEYCSKNGTDRLQNLLIEKINAMSAELGLNKAVTLYASGNVTMLHILFGVDCSGLGVAPYTAKFLESKQVTGKSLGLNNIDEVVALPSVHTFFGADLTAGVNYAGYPQKGFYNLLVDLGTNAEIMLYSEDKAICTSAAAGPCFEGVNISCGMSATEGAISGCELLEDRICVETIGDAEPKGICGTGLVDIIACLLRKGIIDKTGYMECESFEIVPNIYVTQKDIRQYQLAKSAVRSAVEAVIAEENVSFEQIERMYISGGFSSKININNAVATGVLPEELKRKCVAINNSSLLGTVKFACEQSDISQFLINAKYIDLSCNPNFSDLFIVNMDF